MLMDAREGLPVEEGSRVLDGDEGRPAIVFRLSFLFVAESWLDFDVFFNISRSRRAVWQTWVRILSGNDIAHSRKDKVRRRWHTFLLQWSKKGKTALRGSQEHRPLSLQTARNAKKDAGIDWLAQRMIRCKAHRIEGEHAQEVPPTRAQLNLSQPGRRWPLFADFRRQTCKRTPFVGKFTITMNSKSYMDQPAHFSGMCLYLLVF